MGEAWYVLHCAARHDRQVEQQVRLRGVESFAPRVPKTRARNGDRALFPGYVFVRLDLSGDRWPAIRSLHGVRSLVTLGGGPCSVDDEVVATIRSMTEAFFPGRPGAGDPITGRSRIVAAVQGILTESRPGDVEAAIMTIVMGREQRVERVDRDAGPSGGGVAA